MANRILDAIIGTLMVMISIGLLFAIIIPVHNVLGVLLCVLPIVAIISFPLMLFLLYLRSKGIIIIPH